MKNRRIDTRARPAFIATTGGHLVQLTMLAPVLEPERHEVGLWITHDTEQSRALLAGRQVHYVPFIKARDWASVVSAWPRAVRLLRSENIDVAYSTGAALALAVLPVAGLVGVSAKYIESLARSSSFSLTGSVLGSIPWVEVFTQHEQRAGGRWHFRGSLLDGFTWRDGGTLSAPPKKFFVTLGTARPWQFQRLIETVCALLPPGSEVLWQTGATDVGELVGTQAVTMSGAEFEAAVRWADVVVSHAGCGSLLTCLTAGKAPVLVPRRLSRGEHIDDHQVDIALAASARGVAIYREVEELRFCDFEDAFRRQVVEATLPGMNQRR